jgi:hypothetical protein
MICKWMRQTALFSLAGLGAIVGTLAAPTKVRADAVTGISTLSQANRLSLFHDYSLNAVGLSSNAIPDSTTSGFLTPLFTSDPSSQPADFTRAYSLSGGAFAGYDSNPEARRFADDGQFAGIDLNAEYHFGLGPDDATLGQPTQFQFAYDFTGAIYDGGVLNADTTQQTLSGSYRRRLFHDQLALGVIFDDQFTTEHGVAFLNTFDISPSIEWFLTPQLSLEANYDYTRLDFLFRKQPRRSPDSNRHTVNTKFHFYSFPQQRGEIPESPDQLGDILRAALSRFTIGYAYVANEADGLDYVYDSNRLTIGLEGIKIPRVKWMTMDMTYAHEWQNFINPSVEGPIVLAGKPKQLRRKDHIDVFTLRANADLLDLPQDRGTLSTFLQWDLLADRSTIESRHYNEFVISGGLNYRY